MMENNKPNNKIVERNFAIMKFAGRLYKYSLFFACVMVVAKLFNPAIPFTFIFVPPIVILVSIIIVIPILLLCMKQEDLHELAEKINNDKEWKNDK